MLQVLPNPVRRGEALRIRLAAELPESIIELLGINGQRLGQREVRLPTTGLPPGVYSLGLRLAEEVRWVKVVVQ